MPTVISSIVLVVIMQVQPYPIIRALDRFTAIGECDARIALVKDYEKDKPKSDQIGNRLQCLEMQYVSDYDSDGPAPSKALPKADVPHTAYPCRDVHYKKPVVCKDASYVD